MLQNACSSHEASKRAAATSSQPFSSAKSKGVQSACVACACMCVCMFFCVCMCVIVCRCVVFVCVHVFVCVFVSVKCIVCRKSTKS